MTHEDAIGRLGGITKLARDLGCPNDTGLHWASRGIPSRFWPAVEHLARKAGHRDITAAALAAAYPGKRRVSAIASGRAGGRA